MQLSAEKIWNSAQEQLRSKLGKDTYNMWFAPLRASAMDGSQVTLETPNEFSEVWLKDNYISLLQDAVAVAAGRRLQVKFKIGPEMRSVHRRRLSQPQPKEKPGNPPKTGQPIPN